MIATNSADYVSKPICPSSYLLSVTIVRYCIEQERAQYIKVLQQRQEVDAQSLSLSQGGVFWIRFKASY